MYYSTLRHSPFYLWIPGPLAANIVAWLSYAEKWFPEFGTGSQFWKVCAEFSFWTWTLIFACVLALGLTLILVPRIVLFINLCFPKQWKRHFESCALFITQFDRQWQMRLSWFKGKEVVDHICDGGRDSELSAGGSPATQPAESCGLPALRCFSLAPRCAKFRTKACVQPNYITVAHRYFVTGSLTWEFFTHAWSSVGVQLTIILD